MENEGIPYAVTASTGAAAVQIGGVTVHRWSGCGVFAGTAANIAKQIMEKNPKAKYNWIKTHVLFIGKP